MGFLFDNSIPQSGGMMGKVFLGFEDRLLPGNQYVLSRELSGEPHLSECRILDKNDYRAPRLNFAVCSNSGHGNHNILRAILNYLSQRRIRLFVAKLSGTVESKMYAAYSGTAGVQTTRRKFHKKRLLDLCIEDDLSLKASSLSAMTLRSLSRNKSALTSLCGWPCEAIHFHTMSKGRSVSSPWLYLYTLKSNIFASGGGRDRTGFDTTNMFS